MPIRTDFPKAGEIYQGGISDGWEYRLVFAGAKYANTYKMVTAFLKEEGYGDLPLPATSKELLLFRNKRTPIQLELFGENGYIHNPIKILFPTESKQRAAILLCIYKEDEPNHFLRFHGFSKEV